ncbi:MAG: two-component regulator propeller domain-containing protein [Gemmatimonadota bacterium]|nr:two-component regulator propeller domain-containing protein [Gemmatimonadota bacterium]
MVFKRPTLPGTMRLRPLLSFFLVTLVAAPATLAGQTAAPYLDPDRPLTELTVDLWTEDDGLPQNMASAIAQTPDGFMWLGMERGLVRFDGATFRVYDPENTPELSTPWITALWPDPDGTLWIGTAGGGLLRFRSGTFAKHTTGHGLPGNDIRALFRDTEGRLWVGTRDAGAARREDDGTFTVFTTDDGLASDFVLDIGQDRAGAIWLGTAEGLTRIEGNETRTYSRNESMPGGRVNAVLGARDGSLWAGTSDGGLVRVRDGTLTTLSTADGLSSDYVTSLYENPVGTLWVGTNGGGLNRIRDGRITSLTTADNLPGDLILSVAGDRDGGVWLGMTGAGLGRMREGLFRVVGRPEGLSTDIALALAEDAGGNLWIGTAGGGLNRLTEGGIETYTTEQGLGHDVILAVEPTATPNDVWVGMAAGGLSRVTDEGVTTFEEDDGLLTTQIADIEASPEGGVWLATGGNGLQRWNDGPAGVLTSDDGLPSDVVTTLHFADDGALWIGTQNGLGRLEDGEVAALSIGAPGTPANHVTELSTGRDGSLWVTTNGGLGRVRGSDVSFFGPEDGPFGGQVHAAVEDTLGFVWVSTNEGIARMRVSDLEDEGARPVPFRMFERADGLRSNEANGGVNPAGIRRRDGSIWFPTMRGAASIQPMDSFPERPTPEPILESVVVNEVPHPIGDGTALETQHRTLEFHFTAPTYVAPEEINFRYRLDGFDDEWVESGDRRAAYYTNLPPGTYRFQVAVRRGAGEWTDASAAQTVTLEPFFHETGLFRGVAALLLLVGGGTLYRWRVRRLEDRQRELLTLTAEQQRAERALRESQNRLTLALRSGRMGTWEWDLHTGALTLDQASADALGAHPATGEEMLEALRPKLSPEDHAKLAELESQVAAGAESIHLDFALATDSGARYVELRGQTFFDDQGRPDHVMGVVADVSDLMTTQAELRRREEELREAQKMEAVGRLAGGVAHDFNNLLTAILGRAHFLADHVSDTEAREDLEEIQRSAERAANLTQQLLMFSRRQVVQPQVLDLNTLIQEVERMLRRLVREDVTFETRLDPELVPVRIDPGSMEQILVNLVVNAQDAMPEGGVLRIETSNDADTHAVVTVSDTGEGMTAETLEHVFDPFYTTKPVGKGTGLGLSTVYGIVQQARGEVRVDSRPGDGTTFRIYLPRVPDEDAPAVEATDTLPAESHATADGNGTDAGSRPSHTILLVEDDDAVRPLMARVLERAGYAVIEASSGSEALEITAGPNRSIDLIVSDVVMPGMSGRELSDAVREHCPDAAVLLVSGHHEDEVLRKGINEQEVAFLRKPFDTRDLVQAVRTVLDPEGAR